MNCLYSLLILIGIANYRTSHCDGLGEHPVEQYRIVPGQQSPVSGLENKGRRLRGRFGTRNLCATYNAPRGVPEVATPAQSHDLEVWTLLSKGDDPIKG